MAKRKIVWTRKAQSERKEILEYWLDRNKSNVYPIKLSRLIRETLDRISIRPYIGKPTSFKDVRVVLVKDYLIFYRFDDDVVFILAIWDSRREEGSLNLF